MPELPAARACLGDLTGLPPLHFPSPSHLLGRSTAYTVVRVPHARHRSCRRCISSTCRIRSMEASRAAAEGSPAFVAMHEMQRGRSRIRAVTVAAVAGMSCRIGHDPDAGVALTRLPDEPKPRERSGARTTTVAQVRCCGQQLLRGATQGRQLT